MKISYNQLKNYIKHDQTPEQLSEILTDIGLEVEGLEKYVSLPGGLEGLVTGKVKTCQKHPNADKLSITTVDIAAKEPLQIVCGAPNVAEGQTVIVACIGAKLHFGENEITIKKSKIRGELSEGMICAEDEIGLGESHDGILVLPENVPAGIPAKEYFNIETDYIFEIGLTPNRADAASHIGVARDLLAFFRHSGKEIDLDLPAIDSCTPDNKDLPIDIQIEAQDRCKRYAGVTIKNVTVEPSPKKLQQQLQAIGIQPINNIVDITNYVLHETGQPLHAFDYDKIEGKKIRVNTLPAQTPFVTLDEKERKLDSEDLMICDAKDGLCIAGVFGGKDSGVTTSTKNIFLESAFFDPVSIRKTSKRHALQTDASFRFERGVDPNGIIYALKRAASLIKEIAGGEIASEIIDLYPAPIPAFSVEVSYSNISRLIGQEIAPKVIDNILNALEINIVKRISSDILQLEVPPYRVDVKREADIAEEILRIYGYNNISLPDSLKSTLSYAPKPNENSLREKLSAFISAQGFSEAMSNSLTKSEYYTENSDYPPTQSVRLLHALSNDLNVMRQDLFFGSMEYVIRNINHKVLNIRTFEFGNTYQTSEENKQNVLSDYKETHRLALTMTGSKVPESWNTPSKKQSDFFDLKNMVDQIFHYLHFDSGSINSQNSTSKIFAYGLHYSVKNKTIADFGKVHSKYLNHFGIEQPVYFADLHWQNILALLPQQPKYTPVSKFPAARRDMALLLDKQISFSQIEAIALKTEKKLLKEISVFDVFEDKKLGENKKSYALSFVLQQNDKTLTDKQIDKVMKKLQYNFEKELGAKLR
ncbi:MAG: phenylalanine--tRNA ligase subunit beta [Bacteroidia bacterium]|nr:MAG: phenylalanine--tRNA ligase subunit beta [Bacteroidia bacterium]